MKTATSCELRTVTSSRAPYLLQAVAGVCSLGEARALHGWRTEEGESVEVRTIGVAYGDGARDT